MGVRDLIPMRGVAPARHGARLRLGRIVRQVHGVFALSGVENRPDVWTVFEPQERILLIEKPV